MPTGPPRPRADSMRFGNGALLLAVGLFLLWLVVTGRLSRAAAAWNALVGTTPGAEHPTAGPAAPGSTGPGPIHIGALPPLQAVGMS